MTGIYIHIPFCAVKCPYCDFYSLPARPAEMDAYLRALLSEVSSAPEGISADTVYFGGGTPILFGAGRLSAVLKAARNRFLLAPDAEITLEANPFSLPQREYNNLLAAGFNRISFGVQSAVPAELKALGRLQGPKQVERAVRQAKEAGFQNLSADVMLGIPGQTAGSLKQTVLFLSGLGLQHISAYLLKVEEGTPFAASGAKSLCPDEDEQAELYFAAVFLLEEAGFRQYEISNFAKPGFESRHNLKYWKQENYLGFGPAAHSFYEGRRYAHPRDFGGYIQANGQNAILTEQQPDPVEETVMLRLRLSEGLDLALLPVAEEQKARLLDAAKPLETNRLLTVKGQTIALTPKGFLVSNAVILRLLSALNG